MTELGFIGLGVMGTPMALNLLRAGHELTVWNRTAEKCVPLVEAGATRAETAADVFAAAGTVFLMLIDEPATDAVLDRDGPTFAERVKGRTVVQMGTLSAEYSKALHDDIAAAGGTYVEAPVSGSRGPAEAGQLVAMVSGGDITALLEPMCAKVVDCGPVPGALLMKFAVNTFLITMATGLVEAFSFAERAGLDAGRLAEIIDAGPMSSGVSRAKTAKVVSGDFSVQAACSDVLKNNRLVLDAARAREIPLPLMDVCLGLFTDAVARGRGGDDMVGVIAAYRALT
jgi:3-hydroxyisobutyrate dehydrogenase